MSIATTMSRITGFVRIWATALALGATGLASAYNVANNIPNMIFELVAGGILSSLFIPTYLEVKARRGDEAAGRFAGHVFTLFVLALGTVALIGTLFPQPFIWTQTFRSSTGAGAEVMRRIAAPMVGGMVSSTVLTLVVIPALYSIVLQRRLARQQAGTATAG